MSEMTADRTSAGQAPVEPFLKARSRLAASVLEALLGRGEILEYKVFARPNVERRPSVVRWSEDPGDPLIVKLWYRKPRWSSDLLVPYSHRFRLNAGRLRARGVAAPEVIGWGRIEPGQLRFVSYRALPGEPLADRLPHIDLEAMARYVLRLHDLGIDFRALHAGNILFDDRAGYGLIDVNDCRFHRRPLSPRQRARRLARFCAHGPDRWYFLENRRWAEFVMSYCRAWGASVDDSAVIHDAVRRRLDG